MKNKKQIIDRLNDLIELVESCPELFHDSIDEDIIASLNYIISLANK